MEAIEFNSGGLVLEGLYSPGTSDRGVVITHPHPLYGGDMHNAVVAAVAAVYRDAGFACLRFNFRGVGRSAGNFDNGQGEVDDVAGAVDFLAKRAGGDICLAGYSFGSWVNARLAPERAPVVQQVMVSPPVAFIDFADVQHIPTLKLVVTGSRDDIAPPDMVAPLLPGWNPAAQLEIIRDADHFYGGCFEQLKSAIGSFLSQ